MSRLSRKKHLPDPVMVPHWVRGAERAEMVAPRAQPLHILGLGGSVGTPAGGITADVVVVGSFAELDRLGEAVKGKIVLYDVPYAGYGPTVAYRFTGASHAAKWGAVPALPPTWWGRSLARRNRTR